MPARANKYTTLHLYKDCCDYHCDSLLLWLPYHCYDSSIVVTPPAIEYCCDSPTLVLTPLLLLWLTYCCCDSLTIAMTHLCVDDTGSSWQWCWVYSKACTDVPPHSICEVDYMTSSQLDQVHGMSHSLGGTGDRSGWTKTAEKWACLSLGEENTRSLALVCRYLPHPCRCNTACPHTVWWYVLLGGRHRQRVWPQPGTYPGTAGGRGHRMYSSQLSHLQDTHAQVVRTSTAVLKQSWGSTQRYLSQVLSKSFTENHQQLACLWSWEHCHDALMNCQWSPEKCDQHLLLLSQVANGRTNASKGKCNWTVHGNCTTICPQELVCFF